MLQKPSSSTIASIALGAPVAILVAWVLKQFAGIDMPSEVQGAVGALVSACTGYFFIGGKASDTE